MLNQASIDTVAQARIDDHLSIPLYDSYCFSQVPSLVRSRLSDYPTGMPASVLPSTARPKNVVLFLLDGFGWRFFEQFVDELPFLRRFVDDGVASKLTSQFPSTTAPHVTTLHTGEAVGTSGVFEWYYYEPELDEIFMPLPSLSVSADALTPAGVESNVLYPNASVYRALADNGITPHCYQSERYARSTYSTAVTDGALAVPFRTLPEAMVQLVDRVTQSTGSSYHCVYIDVIDSISHRYGPDSAHIAAEIRALFRLLEAEVAGPLAGTDTLVLITADHGHIEVEPERTVYVDELIPEATDWLSTTRDGRPLVPGGSPRDFFMYVRPSEVDRAYKTLGDKLDGIATVHRVRDMVDDGYFGRAEARLEARLAPLVILPKPREMVWWRGGGRFEIDKSGYHGGLSAEELEIPLLAWHP